MRFVGAIFSASSVDCSVAEDSLSCFEVASPIVTVAVVLGGGWDAVVEAAFGPLIVELAASLPAGGAALFCDGVSADERLVEVGTAPMRSSKPSSEPLTLRYTASMIARRAGSGDLRS